MKPFDVVAVLEYLPEQHLSKGQVGTVVETLSSDTLLVEFSDLDGISYAIEPIPGNKLMELLHTSALAA